MLHTLLKKHVFIFIFLIQGIVKYKKERKHIFLYFLQHFWFAVILNDMKPFNLLLICLHIIRLDLCFMLCLELLHKLS